MRIEDIGFKGTAVVSAGFGAVGMLGGFMIRSMFSNYSTLGTSFACALIPGIAGSIFFGTGCNIPAAVCGVIVSYPAAVIVSNVFSNVAFLHPAIALTAGVVVPVIIGTIMFVALTCLGFSVGLGILGNQEKRQ